MKKISAIIVMLAMLITCCPVVFAAGAVLSGVSFVSGDKTDTTAGGFGVYEITNADRSIDGNKLYFNVNDSLINGNTDRSAIKITVGYFDKFGTGNGGSFYLEYDGQDKDGNKKILKSENYGSASGVGNNGSGQVTKTEEFILYDAYMGNSLTDGADFAIVTNEFNVYIYSVKAEVLDYTVPVTVTAETGQSGNIFFDGSDGRISVKFDNLTDTAQNVNAGWKILRETTDVEVYENTPVAEGAFQSENITANGNNVQTIDIDDYIFDYGCYMLKVSVGDAEFDIPFSKAVLNTRSTRSQNLGVATDVKRAYTNGVTVKEIDIIDKSGLMGIRTGGVYWDSYENPLGTYNSYAERRDYYEKLKAKGLYLTQIMQGNNRNVPYTQEDIEVINANDGNGITTETEPTMNDFPMNEAQQQGFADAANKFLDDFGQYIDTFEMVNEPEYGGANRYGIPGTYYASLVKKIYATAKEKHPDIEFGAYMPTTFFTGNDSTKWFNDSYSDTDGNGVIDISESADVITAHPYVFEEYDNSGMTIQTAGQHINDLKSMLESKGITDKKLQFTEFGYTSAVGVPGSGKTSRIGDRKQAANNIRNIIEMLGNKSGDKYFIYTFSNHSSAEFSREDNYGMVRSGDAKYPYAAKQMLVALSNLNELIGKYDDVEKVYNNEAYSVYKFINKNRTVYTFSGEGETSYTFSPDETGYISFYDMLGNPVNIAEDNGSYDIAVTEYPMYAVIDNTEAIVNYTMDNNRFIAAVTFPSAKSGDTVSVKRYKDGVVETTESIRLNSRKTCHYGFDYDNAAYDVSFEVAGKNIKETISFSSDEFVNVNIQDGVISLDAYFPDSEAGEYAAIEIDNSEDAAVYYDQRIIDAEHKLSGNYKISDSGEYKIKIGMKSRDVVYIKDFEGYDIVFSVKRNGKKIENYNDLFNDSLPNISVRFNKEPIEFSIIAATYNESGALDGVKIIPESSMLQNENTWSYDLTDLPETNNTNRASFYLFGDLNQLIPLAKNIELN